MTALARPDLRLHETWADAMSEHHPEGLHVNGSGLWMLPEDGAVGPDRGRVPAARRGAARRRRASPTDDDKVPCEFFWMTDGPAEEVVGFLALRTRLNDWLLNEGGHIGYSVRPSRRREGHASRALGLAVRRAAELGIERALVTCDDDNVPSARTIERNGGVFEDTRNGKRRYWIETGARTSPRRRRARGGRT